MAQAFNQALCAGVNVIIPNFLGCPKSSTSTTFSAPAATVHAAGIEQALSIPTTTTVATFNGHSLLTGTCSSAHPIIATLENGGLLEYPRVGCSNEEPACCPFNVRVGGLLSICPADYTTTNGACCPSYVESVATCLSLTNAPYSGWSIYTSNLAGKTPCFTTTSLNVRSTTTVKINQRDIISPTNHDFIAEPSSPDKENILVVRQTLAPVQVITTHLFTLKYNLAPTHSTNLSLGAKIGIGVGAGLGGILILSLIAYLAARARRRKHKRQLARINATKASSGVGSPRVRTPASSHPSRAQALAANPLTPRPSTPHASTTSSPMMTQYSAELSGIPALSAPQQYLPPLPEKGPLPQSIPPQELSAAPASPTAPPVTPPVRAPVERRAGTPSAEFESHQFYSPSGGKFR